MSKKSVIVTGAGQGIGFAIAVSLASEGYGVVINDLDVNLLKKLQNTIGPQDCKMVVGDSANMVVINEMVLAALNTFGRLDAVVANCGITTWGDFLSYTPEMMEKLLHVNIFGSFFLAQKAAKAMIGNNTAGKIIFMSSVTGHLAHANLVPYGMTKAALEQLAKNLVVELGPHNITVNSIAPGFTETERTATDPVGTATWNKITPLKKVAKVDDIANLVAFLISDKAGHITGQSIVVDGGWTSVGQDPYGSY